MSGVLKTVNNLNYSSEKMPDGRTKLTIEIPNERFSIAKDKVFKRLAPTVSVSGFRPGKAPKNVIEANLGPKLFEETLGEIVPVATVEVLKNEEMTPIDRIEYQVQKVADGSGVTYAAIFTLFPVVKLPKLSGIKISKGKAVVTDDEIETVLKQMFDDAQKASKDKEKDKKEKIKMDDDWAASLNIGVKTIKDLKERIKQELTRQKEVLEQNKYIDAIVREIMKKTKFDVPQTLVDQEVNTREAEYKQRIERLGMKVEDFLRNQKTTLEKLRKDWEKEAGDKVKAEIILMQIAKDYKITVKDEEVDSQIKGIKDENLRKQYANPQAKAYIRSIIIRQKVVELLIQEVEGKKK